jgi:hypothetical protein
LNHLGCRLNALVTMTQELKRVDLPSKKDQPKMNAEQIVRKIHDLEQRQHTETLTLKVRAGEAPLS